MKVRKYREPEERTILTAMIVHSGVLDKICRRLRGADKPFRSKWSNQIAQWCVEHFHSYGRAPRRAIETYFTKFAQTSKDQDTVELLEKFLSGLSDDYKGVARELNEPYVIDLASAHFRKVQLERTARGIEAALEVNDADEAEALVTGYEKIQFGNSDWINPWDPDIIRDALTQKEDQSLIEFKGDLGKFLNRQLERDGFIALMGPEKRGKSFWLTEFAWQAVRQRRRVAYYIVGDMTQRQVMQRFLVRVARQPLEDIELDIPLSFKKTRDGDKETVGLRTDTREFRRLTFKAAREAMEQVLVRTAAKKPRLKLRCVEASTISAGDIEREHADFAKEDWVPDVTVIDYADNLLAEPHTKHMDHRHQVNESWKIFRRISQRYHNLLITATQAAATSYDAHRIKKGDFSEDKRKAAHVTGMLGLNQTADEKKKGIYRLNWLFVRDSHWADSQEVYTAGNLKLACPCMISSF